MTAVSFDPSGTLTCPRVRRLPTAHALTRCNLPVAVFASAERRDLPSMATGVSPLASQAAVIHRPKAAANRAGSSLANTRSNVSALGMPLASGRKRRKKSSLQSAYSWMSSHVSAPPMTAQVARVRMSVSACNLFAVSRRGSGTSANTAARGNVIGVPPKPPVIAANPHPVSRS